MSETHFSNNTLGNFPNSLSRLRAAVCLGLASIQPSSGVVMSAGSNDQDYKDYGASFVASNKVAAFRVLANGTQPEIFASATPINSRFAITSAHAVTGIYANREYQVFLGNDFNNPVVTLSISNVFVYPGYNGTLNSADLAVIEFATPYEGFTQATFGSATSGQVVSSAGYGYAMRPGDPVPSSQDGFVRGWNSRVSSTGPSSHSTEFYNFAVFENGRLVNNDGYVLGGDSGSPVFNPLGQHIGMNTSRSAGIGEIGWSTYLDLTPGTDWVNWIADKTKISEPLIPAVAPKLAVSLNSTNLSVSWDEKAVGWILQKSEVINTWTNVGGAITAPGTYSANTGESPLLFFRLMKP